MRVCGALDLRAPLWGGTRRRRGPHKAVSCKLAQLAARRTGGARRLRAIFGRRKRSGGGGGDDDGDGDGDDDERPFWR